MQPDKQTSIQEPGLRDIQISLYSNCKATSSQPVTIDRLFALIRSGDSFKHIIEQLRSTESQNRRDELKRSLPAVTVSGLFKSRKKENLAVYSGLMQIDLDKIENLAEIRFKLEKDKICFAVFLSPSGNGLKIIVRVPIDSKNHTSFFLNLEKYFLKNYSLQIDNKCKDLARLMFLSWDENLFINKNAIIFSENEIQEKEFIKSEKKFQETVDFLSENDFEEKEFKKSINYLNKKENFKTGNRNNFILRLASLCCQRRISLAFTEKEIVKKYTENDFPESEIKITVGNAFKNPENAPKKIINKKKEETGYSKFNQVEKYLIENYEFRNNIVSVKVEFRVKNAGETFKDLNDNNVYVDLLRNNLEIAQAKLTSLLNSDFVKVFNPFLDYFKNLKKWDSKTEIDFIEKLCSYISVKDTERFKKHFKKMLVRCIACALDDKVFNKQAFIFVHDQQGSGKTSFCRWLCPPALSDYIAENINTDKDSQITLATMFLINMDELATLRKVELDALKSFISKDKINLRIPFDRRTSTRPRRANFIGSTNKDQFLTDETGSVRWLCFELTEKINFEYKNEIDINDVWRQAYTLYIEGFPYQLTQAEVEENETVNKQYLVYTPEMDMIPKYFKPGTKDIDIFMTATDILNEISIANPQIKFNSNSVGKALKILGFTRSTGYLGNTKYTVKGYYVSKP